MEAFKIFIDAGHGGRDPGAVANGMRESDINLEVALSLGGILLSIAGLEVRQSRTTDIFLTINERWQAANAWGADLFVSIHTNAGGGTGVETLIPTASPNNPSRDLQANRQLAEIVSNALASAFGMTVRRANGVMLETETRHGLIGVLRHARMIAILTEIAFIDSPPINPDVDILRNRQPDIARAMAAGIFHFLGVNPLSQTTQPPVTPSTNPQPSAWAREAWDWGVATGITDGTNPQGQPTREQMITLLYRYHNLTK